MQNRSAEARAAAVILACAISAGIHAALAPEHFEETVGAGAGFAVSAALLAVLAVVLTRRPAEPAFAAAALVFAGLIGSYLLAITTGVPLLHPEREPVEGLALFTKAIEAVGLVLALRPSRRSALVVIRPKGHLT
jgi:drug/metabolite transporter (DMT)-like permease